jgi:ribosomal-protein-alanine N-acetyltransferase
MMILHTERLVLLPLAAIDSPLLYPLMSDPDIMAHWDVSPITDPDLVDLIVGRQAEQTAEGKAAYWTIGTNEGNFLGVCDLSDQDNWHKRAEVGFMLAKSAWGQGYAFEAMRAVLEYAATHGFKRLLARTHVGNIASEKLLERLGFEIEGYLRGHVERDGERRDCRLWGLLL